MRNSSLFSPSTTHFSKISKIHRQQIPLTTWIAYTEQTSPKSKFHLVFVNSRALTMLLRLKMMSFYSTASVHLQAIINRAAEQWWIHIVRSSKSRFWVRLALHRPRFKHPKVIIKTTMVKAQFTRTSDAITKKALNDNLLSILNKGVA